MVRDPVVTWLVTPGRPVVVCLPRVVCNLCLSCTPAIPEGDPGAAHSPKLPEPTSKIVTQGTLNIFIIIHVPVQKLNKNCANVTYGGASMTQHWRHVHAIMY